MATKYLAITIAGAVSLGAYEAGATYEILDAIRQHNEDPGTITNGDFIRVDVLTGASAGGMTVAILAQKLLYQKDTFVDSNGKSSPYDNPLYNTWVKAISLAGLLNATDKPISEGGDPATLSLLASSLINKIAVDTLGLRSTTGQVPQIGGLHNAIDPSRSLQLGLALTNINGVNYGYPMFDESEFQYTDFGDQMLRQFSPANTSLTPWQEIGNAAVACGAFPFAFRTKNLDRVRNDYEPCDDSDDTTLEPWPGGDEHTFTYTDGGVLQNQPLGMAKNLVDLNDGHLNNERRFYLFVSPSPMTGEANWKLDEDNTSLLSIGRRLIEIYMGQAGFQDWIEAKTVNKAIDLLDARAKQLMQALKNNEIGVATLTASGQQILALLYTNAGGDEARQRDLQRLTAQYAEEISILGGPATPESKAFLLGILTLEKSADLGERDRMRIYGVVTDDHQLAGAGLVAFVGFFDQAFRDHDYDCGRTVVQKLLSNSKFQEDGQLGPIRYVPAPIRTIDPALTGLKLSDIPKSDVEVLKKGLRKRFSELISDSVSNPLIRGPTKLAAYLVLGALIDWEFSRSTGTNKPSPLDAGVVALTQIRAGTFQLKISWPETGLPSNDNDELGTQVQSVLNELLAQHQWPKPISAVTLRLDAVTEGSITLGFAILVGIAAKNAMDAVARYGEISEGIRKILQDSQIIAAKLRLLLKRFHKEPISCIGTLVVVSRDNFASELKASQNFVNAPGSDGNASNNDMTRS
jgi:Patatin-like phospholipase